MPRLLHGRSYAIAILAAAACVAHEGDEHEGTTDAPSHCSWETDGCTMENTGGCTKEVMETTLECSADKTKDSCSANAECNWWTAAEMPAGIIPANGDGAPGAECKAKELCDAIDCAIFLTSRLACSSAGTGQAHFGEAECEAVDVHKAAMDAEVAELGCGAAHGAHLEAHRIPAWFPLLLTVVYTVILSFLAWVYNKLRKKNEIQFEDFQKKARKAALQRDIDGENGHEDDETVPAEIADIDVAVAASTKEMIHEYGLDGAIYLTYVEQCSVFWALQSVSCGLIFMVAYNYFGDRVSIFDNWHSPLDSGAIPLYAISMANVDPFTGGGWCCVVMATWILFSSIAFAVFRSRFMDSLKLDADEELHTSRCTLWMKKVPTHVTDEILQEWLDEKYPDQVSSARIALNVHLLGANIRSQKKIVINVNKLQEHIVDIPDISKSEKIALHKEKLSKLQAEETALRGMTYVGAGHAFITFKSEEKALEFRVEDRTGQTSSIGADKWQVMMAPLPGEIYWENMGFSKSERHSQKFEMYMKCLVVFIVFLCFAGGAVFFIGYEYMGILYHVHPLPEWEAATAAVKNIISTPVFFFCGGVCAVIFLGMEEEMAPVVKFVAKTEMPTTKSKKQSTYLEMQYLFYLIYHLILSTFGLAFLVWTCIDDDRPRLYVEMVGAFHINRMFLTCAVIDALHTMEGVKFFRRPNPPTLSQSELAAQTGAEAQEDADDIMEEEDPFFSNKFDYTRNYAESLAVFCVLVYYCTMHPAIMPAGSVYYFIKHKLDRKQMSTQYSKPSMQYGRRARTTTKFMLCSIMIGQFGNLAYYLIIAPQHDPTHHHDGETSSIAYAFLLLALIGIMVYVTYSYKLIKLFVKKKKVSNKQKRLSKTQSSASSLSTAGFFEAPYNPPKPEDMVVGVTLVEDIIKDKSPVKFDNPMSGDVDESDDGED